jgi:hypothetical protein
MLGETRAIQRALHRTLQHRLVQVMPATLTRLHGAGDRVGSASPEASHARR